MGEQLIVQGATGKGELLRELFSLEELYRSYRGAVQQYLYRMCSSMDVAEELTQETFVKASVGLLRFRGECSPATWLFRIARNAYLDHLRRPSATRIDTDELLSLPDQATYGDPVRSYSAGEQRSLIALALGQLPEKQRSILLLRDNEGLAYAEIADVLDISLSAVKVNLFRARNAFRVAYCAFDQDGGDQQ